ncbi:peptidoglycan-binding protein [Streptomyces physcomitrii]|uniref:Peptidoglycan DD-metalloendopeptidase family protein n=1 Tax=Streptomyces physcomitrii TaxID=2724184 RepID=A0ABX1GWD5_9ACTN|nr:peptidoglycan-binding protein [Streptomyces physcomitrii]NKI40406.1 peptidoglycan DD-metalloendopeptidase family protein [Streptomyces physcomitrii]
MPRTNVSRAWLAIAALCALLVSLGLAQTAAAAPNWPVLSTGSSGPDVATAQYLLRGQGHDIAADSQFGAATEAATVAFQQSKGYAADGVIGAETWPGLISTVREGDSGDAVAAAQTALNKFGYGLAVDGQFGAGTASAVTRFQSDKGLSADGIVGPETWQNLLGQSGGAAGAYALPIAHDALSRDHYSVPHHDYPALDLPVGTGTAVYSVHAGVANQIDNDRCGLGYEVTGDDGATYYYCHFSAHGVGSGARVDAGTQLGLSGSTGNSTGPHVHVEVVAGGANRCPGPLLTAVYDGTTPPAVGDLPTSGCIE